LNKVQHGARVSKPRQQCCSDAEARKIHSTLATRPSASAHRCGRPAPRASSSHAHQSQTFSQQQRGVASPAVHQSASPASARHLPPSHGALCNACCWNASPWQSGPACFCRTRETFLARPACGRRVSNPRVFCNAPGEDSSPRFSSAPRASRLVPGDSLATWKAALSIIQRNLRSGDSQGCFASIRRMILLGEALRERKLAQI
jgi:hypothetical protein